MSDLQASPEILEFQRIDLDAELEVSSYARNVLLICPPARAPGTLPQTSNREPPPWELLFDVGKEAVSTPSNSVEAASCTAKGDLTEQSLRFGEGNPFRHVGATRSVS